MASPVIHPEDEHLISQLASLQDMHNRISHLRTLPQALVNPVSEMLRPQTVPSVDSAAPAKLYARIQRIAIEGLQEVESFKQSWSSDETQELWKRTLNEPCPQGTDVWRVDYTKALKQSIADQQLRASTVEIPPTDSRDVKDVIEDFRQKHPSMRVESQGIASLLPFSVRVAGMTFRVIAIGKEVKAEYEVQYDQESKRTHLHDGILRHLNQRRANGNLEYLLNMMTSYGDVKQRPCDKCSKLIDKTLTFPIVRNQKASTTPEGEKIIHWEALHADCA